MQSARLAIFAPFFLENFLMGFTVELDVREWVARLDHVKKEAHTAIFAGITKAGAAAKRVAVREITRDMNVTPGDVKKAVGRTRNDPGSLSSSWEVGGRRPRIMATLGARLMKGSGLNASTWRLTGGGSADLHAPKAFSIVAKSGGQIALVRTKHGPGTRRDASALHTIVGEAAFQGMSPTRHGADAAPLQSWKKTASERSVELVTANLQRVLDGNPAPGPDVAAD